MSRTYRKCRQVEKSFRHISCWREANCISVLYLSRYSSHRSRPQVAFLKLIRKKRRASCELILMPGMYSHYKCWSTDNHRKEGLARTYRWIPWWSSQGTKPEELVKSSDIISHYPCLLCGRCYHGRSYLQGRLKLVHEELIKNIPLQYPQCIRQFNKINAWIYHTIREHQTCESITSCTIGSHKDATITTTTRSKY